MRSSAVLTTLFAALSVASPIHMGFHKKDYVYDITTEIVYVTVTMGAPLPSTSLSSDESPQVTTTIKVQHTVVVIPTEAPAPSTTSTTTPPPPPSTTSTTPAAAPTTTTEAVVIQAAPAPETTSTTEAAAATTTAAPVVQVVVSTQAAVVATTASAAASAASPTDYSGVAVWHHNKHRANHTASDLTWSSDLAAKALITANTCVFAHDLTEGGGGYGQNLAAYGSSDLSTASTAGAVADAITNQWYYGEAANMPYGQPSPAISGVPEYLHFSALLWKATTQVGCATVTCAAGTVFPTVSSLYTVCNYASEGNILGQFATQVTEPVGNAGISASVSSA